MPITSTPRPAGTEPALATAEAEAARMGVSRVVGELVLARGQQLARDAKWGESERILKPLLENPALKPRALDLLARIQAQQGHFRQAAATWEELLQTEPDNARATRARNAALGMTPWRRLARPFAAGAVLVCLAAVMSAQVGRALRRRTGPGMTRSLARETAAMPAVHPKSHGETKPIAGWHQVDQLGGTWLVPEVSLFDQGVSLSIEGRAALDALGDGLNQRGSGEVEVRGTTDDLPVRPGASYLDNDQLATRRAEAVAEYLVRAKGFSPTQLAIRPGRLLTDRAGATPKNSGGQRGVVIVLPSA